MRIIAHVPNKEDATSYYRGCGPLSHLVRKNSDISVVYETRFAWSSLIDANILFIQRPSTAQHEALVIYAKSLGLKVWIDYDDDLTCVPTDNPAHGVYESRSVHECIGRIINHANLVTVSTQHLKNEIRNQNGNIHVVSNAIDFDLFPFWNKEDINRPRSDHFIWRGSPTHIRDVMSVGDEIISYNSELPTIFEFIGDRLWMLTDQMDKSKIKFTPPLDIFQYNQHIYRANAKSFIVPLLNNSFNKAKSNITWLEATMSHALTIAPIMPEWISIGAINYSGPGAFIEKMNQVNKMTHEETVAAVKKSQDIMLEKYTLDTVNPLRLKLLKDLVQ